MAFTEISKPIAKIAEPPDEPGRELDPRKTASPEQPEAVTGARVARVRRALGSPRRRLFTVVAREVRYARRESAERIASIYGRSGDFYPYYALAMAKSGRLASRRAALNVVAVRCVLICICCYYAQLWAWSREHSVFTAIGLLAAGGCGGYALRIAARTLSARHEEEFSIFVAYGLLLTLFPAYIWTFTSLASLFPKQGSRHSRLLPHIMLDGGNNLNLTDLVTLLVWLSVIIAGAWLITTATVKLPAKHRAL